MLKSRSCLAVLCIVLLAGTGCRTLREHTCNKPQPYMKSGSVEPLKVPPGLDAPDSTSALRVPPLNEPAPPPRTGKDPCLDEPPSFKVNKPAPAPQA